MNACLHMRTLTYYFIYFNIGYYYFTLIFQTCQFAALVTWSGTVTLALMVSSSISTHVNRVRGYSPFTIFERRFTMRESTHGIMFRIGQVIGGAAGLATGYIIGTIVFTFILNLF